MCVCVCNIHPGVDVFVVETTNSKHFQSNPKVLSRRPEMDTLMVKRGRGRKENLAAFDHNKNVSNGKFSYEQNR